MNTDDTLNDEEVNPLLLYCYSELYGSNYGYRTVIQFDNECFEDLDCEDDEELLRDDEGFTTEIRENNESLLRSKRGLLTYA
jgi:hypothetical protein